MVVIIVASRSQHPCCRCATAPPESGYHFVNVRRVKPRPPRTSSHHGSQPLRNIVIRSNALEAFIKTTWSLLGPLRARAATMVLDLEFSPSFPARARASLAGIPQKARFLPYVG